MDERRIATIVRDETRQRMGRSTNDGRLVEIDLTGGIVGKYKPKD